jgi:RNA polymerase sigma factor (sigma-70 family)
MRETPALNPSAERNPSSDRAGPAGARSDDRLAQRATRGDRRAIEAIYRRYHQELYRFCLAIVGNPSDAQDALQNTMVKVLRALPGEKREIKLKPWLYRIARNEAIETVRSRRDSAELEPEHPSSALEIAQTAEARERLRRLLADLEELPGRQRGALLMRELSGLGFEQIAAAFETSPAVARQTVYEARLSLRQMEEGREMSCEAVTRELSDADGRVTRRREIRAHLRGCASCRAFRDGIAGRRTDFAAIAPLPVAASLGLLHGVFASQASAAASGTAGTAAGAGGAGAAGAGSGAAGTAGGIAGTVGAGAGKVFAMSAIVKSAAAVTVVAAVGVTAADRGGLIDVPLPGRSQPTGSAPQSGTPSEGGATPARQVKSATEGSASAGSDRSGANAKAEARSKGHGGGSRRRGSAQSQPARHPHAQSRPHTERHGRPDGLPAASQHGQQTAAAHKSPHANPSPGGAPSKSKNPPAPSSSPPPPPPASSRPPQKEQVEVPPAPSPPSTEPAGQGKGGVGSKGAGGGPEEPAEP